jgi:hypothetical protein
MRVAPHRERREILCGLVLRCEAKPSLEARPNLLILRARPGMDDTR